VATRSKAGTALALSNTVGLGLNTARGMDILIFILCLRCPVCR
jgi:hypothetical protein